MNNSLCNCNMKHMRDEQFMKAEYHEHFMKAEFLAKPKIIMNSSLNPNPMQMQSSRFVTTSYVHTINES